MLRRLYRQRRRLLIGALFIGFAVFATLMRYSYLLEGVSDAPWIVPASIALTALAVGLAYALVAALVIVLIPDWRGLIEILAITFFADSILAYVAPEFFGVESAGSWGILTWFILYYLIWNTVYGRALDRFRFWLGYKAERSYISPLPVETVWRQHVLGQARASEYYDPLLVEAEPVPDEPDTFEVIYRHGGGIFDHQTITYTDLEPCRIARCYFQGEVDPANRSITEGTWEMQLTEAPKGGTRVTLREHRPAMLPRQALELWMDDHLGDSADRQAASDRQRRDWSLSGRYRRIVLNYA